MEKFFSDLYQAQIVAAHREELTLREGAVSANPTPHPGPVLVSTDRFDFDVVGYTPHPDDPDPDPWPWEPHDAGSKHRYMATDDFVLKTSPHDQSCLVAEVDDLAVVNPDSMREAIIETGF